MSCGTNLWITAVCLTWLIFGYVMMLRMDYNAAVEDQEKVQDVARAMIEDADSPCHPAKARFYRKVRGDQTLNCAKYENELNRVVWVAAFDATLVKHNWCASGKCHEIIYALYLYSSYLIGAGVFVMILIMLCAGRAIVEEKTRAAIRREDQYIPYYVEREPKYRSIESIYGKHD
jgi:hypothetical protein